MKKTIILTMVVLGLTACGYFTSIKTQLDQQIVIGSIGSDAQIWKFIANSDQAKQEHLNIIVKEINDGIALNTATADQQVDVNAFQSWGYFKVYNQQHNNKLQVISATYLEPMGLYSKKYKNPSELLPGSTVAIPSDPANTVRALKLLQKAQLIRLDPNFLDVTHDALFFEHLDRSVMDNINILVNLNDG